MRTRMLNPTYTLTLSVLGFLACGGGGGTNTPTPPAVTVTLSPTTANLAVSGTQAFLATVSNTSNTAVLWAVQEGASGGSVSASGLYTAPATISGASATFHVVATSQADSSKSATATVAVTTPPVSIAISPVATSMYLGSVQQFTATVQNTSDTSVAWSVQEGSAGGNLTGTGLYTAPASISGGSATYHVVATSGADSSKSASATVTVLNQSIDITITPGQTFMTVGAAQAFTAVVNGNASNAVNWSMQEGSAGGSVNANGVYTAPSSIAGSTATVHLVATSVADPNKTSQALINLSTLTPQAHGMVLFSGDVGGQGNVDGVGATARFGGAQGIAVDAAGNLFVADYDNAVLRKLSPAGVVSTFAGQKNVGGGQDGTGSGAQFHGPAGLVVDATGNLFVADQSGNTIRKVTASGVVTTIAGLSGNVGSTDGQGTTARFHYPGDLAMDATGNLYVADTFNFTIRKVAPDGTVSTLAGSPGQAGTADGQGSAARFYYPRGIAMSPSGNLVVADTSNNTLRLITPAGVVSTLAGSAGQSGYQDGPAASARFSGPWGVKVSTDGRIWVTEVGNYTLRVIGTDGVVSTFAGRPSQQGILDGPTSIARFMSPRGLAMDPAGDLFVFDSTAIRKVTPSGMVTTLAGTNSQFGSADGVGSSARFSSPYGLAVDIGGNVYVADRLNDIIRKITPTGTVTTLAGSPGNPDGPTQDGQGSAARFNYPAGMVLDGSGNLYVSDFQGHTIRKLTPSGAVTTLAGSYGIFGSVDGHGAAALFKRPRGLAVDGAGNVYVADSENSTIRKVTPSGDVTTLAGSAGQPGFTDGTGSAARFGQITDLVLDSAGNLIACDNGYHTIRKITPAGVVTTFAGSPTVYGTTDGPGGAARFQAPTCIAKDAAGNFYVSDGGNHTIRKITPTAEVTTLAGAPKSDGIQFGALPGLLSDCQGLAFGPNGVLYATLLNGVVALLP